MWCGDCVNEIVLEWIVLEFRNEFDGTANENVPDTAENPYQIEIKIINT